MFQAAKGCAKSLIKISPEQAEILIRSELTRPEKHPREIAHAISSAYSARYSSSSNGSPHQVEIGEYDPDLLAEHVIDSPEATPEQLARVSPASVDIPPTDYFAAVFPGEIVFATTYLMAKGGFIYKGSHEAEELRRYLDGNKEGAWYLANPVDGEWRGEGENYSCRSEANLTSFRHIVLESDVAPADQWLAMLVQQPLAIVAIYHSGGRSYHALVRTNAKNKAEFTAESNKLKAKYCPLGADKNAMTAVRPTRVPNVLRTDNFAHQRLIYLNPAADEKPIYQKETRPSNQLDRVNLTSNLKESEEWT